MLQLKLVIQKKDDSTFSNTYILRNLWSTIPRSLLVCDFVNSSRSFREMDNLLTEKVNTHFKRNALHKQRFSVVRNSRFRNRNAENKRARIQYVTFQT